MSVAVAETKTALVTGAGKRIGKAIALALARDGFQVAVHYNASTQEAQETKRLIEELGGRAVLVKANLSVENETRALVGLAQDALGPLSVLVNNASVFENDSPENATRASWDLHLETNLRAPFVLIQEFSKQLAEGVVARGEGAVINILDQRVFNLTPHSISYTVSKAGLWALTQTLALALAPRVRVSAVGPGPVLAHSRQTEAQFAALCGSMPLQRGASPEDIAEAVLYLVKAKSVTGQMIAVDGGQHLGYAQPSVGDPGDD